MPPKRGTKYKPFPRIEQRSNGHWYAHLIYEDGERRVVSLKTRNENIARAKYRKLQDQIHAKISGYPRIPTALPFPQAVKRYMEDGTLDLAPSSVTRHQFALKHLERFFGTESLTRIGPERVLDYITARRRAGASPNTLHKEMALLSAIFRFYVQRQILPSNPVLAVDKPAIRLVRPNYAPTVHEVIKILNHISPYARRFFLCLWATGARFSEIQKANVGDVDLEAKTIRLRRKGGRIQTVGLNSLAYEIIMQELSIRPRPGPSEPLFINRLGKRVGKIHEALEHACQNAGVPYVSHHGLRHSFARTLRRQKYSLQEIGKLLGHAHGSSMTVMYADMADDEVIETGQGVSFESVENVIKKTTKG